jgi:hypothetical protein
VRLDLHVHTCYSYDCLLSLQSLTQVVLRRGLDGVAVLDHDEIDGALRLRDWAPFHVIVGEEIGSRDGGIGALFITERIPPHLSAEETITRIHDQGGLVFIPHPLARGVPGKIRKDKFAQIIDQVDVIEGFNARAPLQADDQRARDLAAEHGIAVAAGSDAHWACEVGRAWTEMDCAAAPREFLHNLGRARLHYAAKTPYLIAALTVATIAPRALWRATRHRFGGGLAAR